MSKILIKELLKKEIHWFDDSESIFDYATSLLFNILSIYSIFLSFFVFRRFSKNISPIASHYPPPFRLLFSKNKGGGSWRIFFLFSQKIFAFGELEIPSTKSTPATGMCFSSHFSIENSQTFLGMISKKFLFFHKKHGRYPT